MARAAIGLGSNVGDRVEHLRRAVRALTAVGSVVGRSAVYETAPVGGPAQGPFLNAVVVVDTALSPQDLLAELLAIERIEGRERRVRWGPRTLDLDILLYGRIAVDVPGLEVPHPRLRERRFVLEPLLEAWPDAVLPDGTPPVLETEAAGQEMTRFEDARVWGARWGSLAAGPIPGGSEPDAPRPHRPTG